MAASTTHGIDINVAREGVMSYECGVTPASFGVPGRASAWSVVTVLIMNYGLLFHENYCSLAQETLVSFFMKTQGLLCQ